MLFYTREDPFAIWKADRLEYIILIQISTELTETRLQFYEATSTSHYSKFSPKVPTMILWSLLGLLFSHVLLSTFRLKNFILSISNFCLPVFFFKILLPFVVSDFSKFLKKKKKKESKWVALPCTSFIT